jgi:hypothetical protein
VEYRPVPIDNSRVVLNPELQRLVEILARNNHELWARRRMEEGWRYGPKRDDDKKQTPVLVPYEQLSEREEYDRENAVETLKTIIALGGRVELPPSSTA